LRSPVIVVAEHVKHALAHTIRALPDHLRRSLTWDRGKEMGEHVRFTLDTGVQVYFCDPRRRVEFDDTETKLSAAIDRFTGPPAPPRLR
jgi:hypothetical protein